jgi:membrane protein insertase Oxa1/YidC/SpoIIIJ
LDTLNNSQNIQTDFLVWNIAKPDPFYLIPILVGISQYFLSDMMLDKTAAKKDPSKPKASDPDEMARIMQGQMKYVFPIMSAVITAGLPVGVGIYWLTSVVFAIIQQHLVNNKD